MYSTNYFNRIRSIGGMVIYDTLQEKHIMKKVYKKYDRGMFI